MPHTLDFTFLGTGTSMGVPVSGCACPVCNSLDIRDQRLRTSLLIASDNKKIVIDSGPDFRQQMIQNHIDRLDGLVFTHEHKDHTAGMDDIRAYNFLQKSHIRVFATDRVQKALEQEFHYIFSTQSYPGIPEVEMNTIQPGTAFEVAGVNFEPIQVYHLHLPVLGFRIGDFTYITDANRIDPLEKKKVYGSKVLVLNALRQEEHLSHFNLEQAVELGKELEVPRIYFTHISHQMGLHRKVEQSLPEGFFLAYDGLRVRL